MTSREEIVMAVWKRGGSILEVAEELGIARSSAEKAVQRIRRRTGSPDFRVPPERRNGNAARADTAVADLPESGHGLAELRERFDKDLLIPRAIDDVLAEHIEPDRWHWDSDMQRIVAARCKVSGVTQRWARYRDSERYRDYIHTIDGKRIWVGTAIRDDFARMKAS